MDNKLVVFILSHKSPNKCETLDTLKKLGFNGECFIIIDDEDDCLEEYKKVYNDSLIVYHKESYKYSVDMGYSLNGDVSFSHAVYARNAVEDIAHNFGIKYFAVSDDDIYDFKFRIPMHEYHKLPTLDVEDINEPLSLYFRYVMDCDIPCLGIGTPNFYIGGYDKIVSGNYLNRKQVSNFYIRNLNYKIDWLMPIDDFSTSSINNFRGNLFFSLYPLELIARPQYTQKIITGKEGGEVEFYRKNSTWKQSYCSYILMPSFISLKFYKTRYIPSVKSENAYPKIISSVFKR